MRSFALLVLVASLLCPAQAAAPVDLHEFQQQAADILETARVPGAGIALIKDGEILWAGGIGYADRAARRPVLADTRFRIGSITKTFTALAVLRLVAEDRISLDAPVRDIAPDVPIENPWRATDPVRVAHLLEHSAGFDDLHFRNINTDTTLPDSLATTLARLDHELTVRWRPGVKHSYSNPAYAVAGYLVETVSGVPFHRYVARNVLAPLGLEHIVWGVPDDGDFATGYANGHPVAPRAIRLYPAGELSASSRDLARLVQFFIRRGEGFIPEQLVERMETARTTRAARHGLHAGYGLGNHALIRGGFLLRGHDGGLDGFVAEMAYSPEHGFGYAVLLNRADGAALRRLGELATEFLARDIAPPTSDAFDVAGAAVPENLAGCYRMNNPRNEILHGLQWLVQVACIEVRDGQALLRHPILPQLAVFAPLHGNVLREADGAWPVAVFMRDTRLPDAFAWAGIYFERSNRFAVTAPLVLAGIALLLMLSAFAFFPVWAVRALRGRLRGAPAPATRVWPLLASALFVFTAFWSTRLELALLDSTNAVTLGIFLGGAAFALTSFYALYRVLRTWRAGIHPAVRWHALLVSLACVGVALYLICWKMIPLRLWAW